MDNIKVFNNLLNRWITIENNTIEMANDLMGKTDNPYLKTLIGVLKADSEKHKTLLETIRLCTESTICFSQDDLYVLSSFIEKHDAIEKNAIETANQACNMAYSPIPKLLLSHLIQDEKSHEVYMRDLNQLKLDMSKTTQ